MSPPFYRRPTSTGRTNHVRGCWQRRASDWWGGFVNRPEYVVITKKWPAGSLPLSKPPAGPAPPRRPVCALGTMSLRLIADRGDSLMFSTWFATSTNGKRRSSRRRFVPRLELLEGRALPSTFTVLNLADSGEGSLRQAVLDANAQPGADTTAFADGLNGTIPLTSGQLSITDALTIDGPGAD